LNYKAETIVRNIDIDMIYVYILIAWLGLSQKWAIMDLIVVWD